MSAFMIHSLAFAKWVIQFKLDLQFVNQSGVHAFTSLLDNSLWDEFMLTDDYTSIIKPSVQTIIPLLVQNMPSNTRKFTKKGKSNNDSALDTEAKPTNNNDHIAPDSIAQDKPVKKQRGPNKSKKISGNEPDNTLIASVIQTDVIISDSILPTQDAKPVKKTRGPNKPKQNNKEKKEDKKEEEEEHTAIIIDDNFGQSVDIVQSAKPVKKTRGPNKPKQNNHKEDDKQNNKEEEHTAIIIGQPEPIAQDAKPVKKTRGPNKPKKNKEEKEEEDKQNNKQKEHEEHTAIIIDDNIGKPEPIVQDVKPVKKQRGPNKPKQNNKEKDKEEYSIVSDNIGQTVQQDVQDEDTTTKNKKKMTTEKMTEKKTTKKKTKTETEKTKTATSLLDIKNHKHTNVYDDDVVIPVLEFAQLDISNHSELQEESFQNNDHEIELTEIFIQDVLFYVDSNDNWFDSYLNSVLKPTF
jgi:hypothetical protein